MNAPAADDRPRLARLAERGFFAASAAAWLLTVLRGAGAPESAAMAAAAVAIALGLAAVLRSPAGRVWLDGPRLALAGAGLFVLGSVYLAVGGDGYEYYALLRSPVLDGDLDFVNDFEGLGSRLVHSSRGEVTSRVAMGVSLFWAPHFLLAHLLALAGLDRADGFGPLYQAAVTTASYVYAFAALVLIESMLRRRVSRAVALLAVLAIWLATPLHFYMTANPSMSHGVSVFAATAMVWLWFRARGDADPRQWALVGLAGGLLALVRPQDAVLLAIPALDLLFRRRAGLRPLGGLLLPIALLGLAQIGLWFALYGPGFTTVVRETNLVAGIEPHVLDFLFAARHGMLTWTPLYVAALAGWIVWAARERRVPALFATAFALSVLVNSTTSDWWGSESFGQRRMLAFTPLFALGLAEMLDWLRRRPLVPIAAGLALLALWNLQFEYIYNSGLVAGRSQAIDLDRLLAAQVDVAHRRLVRWHGRIPAAAWVLAHDNLNGVWIDEGTRSLGRVIDFGREPEDLPLVVGHGWYEPEQEGEVGLRRSKGWRSWLRVPVRTAAAARITVRARRGVGELPVRVRVEVNGTAAGESDLPAEWADLAFDAPKGAVRRGLNDVAFIFSATPRRDIPGYRGKDAAAAVDFVRWERRP
ncbi:MAG TPA: hypothetical protein VMT87_10315 [Vicinamibacteria bacterium]|nr:hypothetical protein [Vicinamibacteria bacterium]